MSNDLIDAQATYTDFDDLVEELNRRRNNQELMKKVRDFFGQKGFSILDKEPRAILSRCIVSPNYEMKKFIEYSEKLKMKPLLLEYPDKFVAKNAQKYHLSKLYFCKNNEKKVVYKTNKIIDFKDEGKVFSEIKTLWGDEIVNFHHKILFLEFPNLEDKILNFSDWFNQTRNLSKYYYLFFLSLFICNGILFENFLIGDKEEERFIREKFLPSFNEVKRIFNVKPLIFPFLPLKSAKDPYWHYYSESLEHKINKLGIIPSNLT